MIKHTPGTWHDEPCGVMRPNERLIVAHHGKENGIELITTVGRVFETENTQGDAHLIAAAPELLEALRRLVQATDYIAKGEDRIYWTGVLKDAHEQAETAIAKAEGK